MSGAPVVAAETANDERPASTYDPKDEDTVETIKELLDTRVRPAVAKDGGDIIFHGFRTASCILHMRGACSGCPSSTATLRHGIENLLRHFCPDVQEVRPFEACMHKRRSRETPLGNERGFRYVEHLRSIWTRRNAACDWPMTRAAAAVPRCAHAPRLAAARGARQPAAGAGRPREDGADQRQLPAGPHHLREVEGGQGAAQAAPERRQSRQDHAGARSAPSSATT